MKLRLFILISASVATVGLLGPLPSAFGYSLEPQTNLKETQPLRRDLGSTQGGWGEWIQNQELVQQNEATESIQSLPVAVATPPTQFSQSRLARQTAQYINAFGGVFLPSVFIGYILGEIRSMSIEYGAQRGAVQYRQVIGVFPNCEAAVQALEQLVLSGYLLKKVILVGKDSAPNEQSIDVEIMSALINRDRAGAITGVAGLRIGLAIGKLWGGLIGLLLGLGIVALLGVEQIGLAPAVGFTLLCGGICTVAGGIIGALNRLRISKKQASKYREQVACGNYLLIVNGTKDEIKQAKCLLNTSKFLHNL